jgi:anaerobic ribonucleoside-triphosphate reductase activating protein
MPRVPTLRLGARAPLTEVEGPGLRYALWVQGCGLRCPGCCNPHFFSSSGGAEVAVDALLREVDDVRARIEGITLLGGEPFEQAAPLVHLARGVRARGLSVMAFSGYSLEDLRAMPGSAVRDLLAQVDVLVDGRYDAARPERRRRWAGSENQRFHYLTVRYTPAIEEPGEDEPLRGVEVRVGVEGGVVVNGWPAMLPAGRL